MKITCCNKCTDRAKGCHGYCETYLQQREKLMQEKALIHQEDAVFEYRRDKKRR